MLAFVFPVAAAEAPTRDVSGRWAMSWQTHTHGVKRSGYLIIKQKGAALDVVLTGEGELHASGAMRGVLKVPGLDKPFTATREH